MPQDQDELPEKYVQFQSTEEQLDKSPVPIPATFSSLPSARLPGKKARKSLWPIYNTISAYEYRDPGRAYQRIDELLEEGLNRYTAPPDTWHNTAMVAGRVRHREAQLAIVEAGLEEWPDNVDLLCDAMSYRQSTHYDPDKLEQIWNNLHTMDPQKTAPYWRFWVYGATYHALERDDPQKGEELLDQGMRSVRRDAVMDILRSYRRIYVDSIPMVSLDDDGAVAERQEEALNKLEQRLQLGIELGVENAYVLATELARVYQERAGCHIVWPESGETEEAPGTANKRDEYLDRALAYLDLAEKLYTANPNHPVWEIYEPRIRIFMAQRRYGDAFKLLRSLPEVRLREDPSLNTMLNLAAEMTGEKLDEGRLSFQQVEQSMDVILAVLLGNKGDLLYRLAREHSEVQQALDHVMLRLRQDGSN